MPSFADLYQVMSQQAAQQAPQQPSMQNYQNLYQQLLARNQELAGAQQQQQQPTQSVPQLGGWYQDNPEAAPTRNMNMFERGLTGLSDWGEGLMGITGWSPEKGFTPENIARFAVGLPFQMVGGLASAPAQGYEAFTGNNILDRPDEEGMAYQYELSPSQQLSQLGNFLINGPAMFVGGSARALGTGAKMLTGGRIGESMASGMIGRNLAGSSKAARTAGQISFDVAEEASEEFGQSFLDDTRWNTWDDGSLDRALTGAAWGALGGGMFSAGAHGVNALFDKNKQTNDGNSNVLTEPEKNNPLFQYQKEMGQSGSYNDLTDYARDEILERMRTGQDQPASASVLNIQRSNKYDLMSAGLGARDIRAMFESNIKGSAQMIATAFGVDRDTMARILFNRDENERVRQLNDLIAKRGGRITVLIGRNPDTNAVGVAKIDITEILFGSGLAMNRDAPSLFGADLDGDKTQVFFDTTLTPGAKYLPAYMLSDVTGKSNFDEDFATMIDTDPEGFYEAVKDFAESKLLQYKDIFSEEAERNIKEALSDYKNIREGRKEGKVYDASYKVLDSIQAAVSDKYGSYRGSKDVAEFLFEKQKEIQKVHNEEIAKAIEEAANKRDIKIDEELKVAAIEVVGNWEKSGRIPKGANFADIAPIIAHEIFSRSPYTNIFFRQTSGEIMQAHRRTERSILSGLSAMDTATVYDYAITYALGLEQFGEDVEDMINGARIVTVQDAFFNAFQGKLITDENVDEALDLLKKIWNEEAGNMREALKKETSLGESLPLGAIVAPEIDESDGIGSNALARAFKEVFGAYYVEEIFDIPEGHPYRGLSIESVLDGEAHNIFGVSESLLSNSSDKLNRLWNSLIKEESSREKALASAVRQQAELNAELMRHQGDLFSAKENADGSVVYVVNPETSDALAFFVQGWQRIIGAAACLDLNIGTVSGFINTRWGREMLSSNPDQALNAIISARLSWQYKQLIRTISELDGNELSDEVKRGLSMKLHSMDSYSFLHSVIAESFDRSPSQGISLLAVMTDLDISLSDKNRIYKDLDLEAFVKGDLLSDAMKSTEGFDVSSASKSLREAKRDFLKGDSISIVKQRQVIAQCKESFGFMGESGFTQQDFYDALEFSASEACVNLASDMIGTIAFSHRQIDPEDRNKGNVRDEIDNFAQALSEMMNGGNFSLVDEISADLGSISIGNFRTNRIAISALIFGRIDEITVYDESVNGRLTLTRDGLLSSIDEKLVSRTKPEQLMAILEKYPNLISVLAPQYISSFSSGGSHGISVGSSYSSLESSLKKIAQDNKANQVEQSKKRVRANIALQLMSKPTFIQDIILATEGIEDSTTSLPEACRSISRSVDKYVDAVMYEAVAGESKAADLRRQRMASNGAKLLSDLDGVLVDAARMTMLLDMADIDFEPIQRKIGQAAASLFSMDVLEGLPKEVLAYLDPSGIKKPASAKKPEFGEYHDRSEVVEKYLKDQRESIILLIKSASSMIRIDHLGEESLIPDDMMIKLQDYRAIIDQYFTENDSTDDLYDKMLEASGIIDGLLDGDFLKQAIFKTKIGRITGAAALPDFNAGNLSDPFTMEDFTDPSSSPEYLFRKLDSLMQKYPGMEFPQSKMKKTFVKLFEKKSKAPDEFKEEAYNLLCIINNKLSQVAIDSILQEMSESDLNSSFIAQEVEAERNFDLAVVEARAMLGELPPGIFNRNIFTDEFKTPPAYPVFNAKSETRAWMASMTSMNMGGAIIGTGIAINGAKTKLLGAFGLVRDSFMEDVIPERHSAYTYDKNASRIGKIFEELCNCMQEPMFLRLKKTLQLPDSIIRKIFFGGKKPEQRKFSAADLGSNPVEALSKMLWSRDPKSPGYIKVLADYLSEKIEEANVQDDLNFGRDEYNTLAWLMLPYVDITIDGYTDSNGVVHKPEVVSINTDRFIHSDPESSAAFAGSFPQLNSAIQAGADIIVTPQVVGFDELAVKVLREVERKFGPAILEGETPTRDNVSEVAEAALRNWEGSNDLTYDYVFKKIQARPQRGFSPAMLSTTRSAAQRWAALHGNKLIEAYQLEHDKTLVAKPSDKDNNSAVERARTFYDSVGGFFNLGRDIVGNQINLAAVSFTNLGSERLLNYESKKAFQDRSTSVAERLTRGALPDISHAGRISAVRLDDSASSATQALDIVYAGKEGEVEKIFEIARISEDNGRMLCLDKTCALRLGLLESTVLSLASLEHTVNIGDTEFVIVDPAVFASRALLPGNIPQIDQFRYDDINAQVTTTIGATGFAGPSDSSTQSRPGFNQGFSSNGSIEIDASRLLPGNGLIELAKRSDVEKIEAEIDKYAKALETGLEPEDLKIDLSSYLGKPGGRSVNSYLSEMKAWCVLASKYDDVSKWQNVEYGACVGFAKTKTSDGSVVYAPVFYEGGGSTPYTASILSLEHDMRKGRGTNRLVISYEGQASLETGSIKMYMDGVAYKTIVSMFDGDPKDWPRIDTGDDPLLQRVFDSPEYRTDAHSVEKRLIEVGIKRLFRNLIFASEKAGGNLFYTRTSNNSWVLKSGFSFDVITSTGATIDDFLKGEKSIWRKVANGRITLFKGDEYKSLNRTIASVTRHLLDAGANPALFFCPMHVRPDGMDPSQRSGKSEGLAGYHTDAMPVLRRYIKTPDKILELFNAMNPSLCYKSVAESISDPDNTQHKLLDHLGQVYISTLDHNGKAIGRVPTVIGLNYPFGDASDLGNPSRRASYSFQHLIKRMLALGYYDEQGESLLKYWAATTGAVDDETGLDTRRNYGSKSNIEHLADWQKAKISQKSPYKARALAALDAGLQTSSSRAWIEKCGEVAIQLQKRISIVENDLKTPVTKTSNPELWERIDRVIDKWNTALNIPYESWYDFTSLSEWVRVNEGYLENDGRGYQALTVDEFVNSVNKMVENITQGKMPVEPGSFTTNKGKKRIRIPLVTRSGMRRLYMSSPKIREMAQLKVGSESEFDGWIKQLVDTSLKISAESVTELSDVAQRTAVRKMIDAVSLSNAGKTSSGYISYSSSIYDIMDAAESTAFSWMSQYDPALASKYKELCRLSDDYIRRLESVAESRKVLRQKGNDGKYTIYKGDDSTIATYILRSLIGARQLLGTLSITMPAANILERLANQGAQSLTISLSQANIGPYAGLKRSLPKGFTKAIAKDERLRKVFSAFRTAELAGVGREFLHEINRGGDIDAVIEEFMNQMSLTEKWASMMTDIVSGKNVAIDGMIRNYLDYFDLHAAEKAPWWLQSAGNGKNLLQAALEQDPARWFIDVIAGAGPQVGADVIFANQALNWAKRGDMAQRNLVSAIYSEIARRNAGIAFLTTSLVSPYFQYATNRIGRILQWVAPISSIHYLLTQSAAHGKLSQMPLWNTGLKFEDLGLDTVQLNASLREAMAIDMMHLGPVLVAFMLVGMAGGIEPPDDEDKWGNFKEWTILGLRVDEAWWIEDTLGLALPMAMFMRSGQLGKPRTDIIINGIAYYLQNNPVTKVADAVSVLFDPFAELYSEYDTTLDSFAKARGGAPSMSEMVQGKATSFGLSYVSQFFTPLFLREIYNASQEYEVSYKRIYEEGPTGQLTEDAVVNGKTQMTTYQDAMIRKYTRNNPVMGFLADVLLRPNTGYMAHEMPRTVYYDPYQMNSLEVFSLYYDPFTKQQPKPEEERQALAYEIIKTLQEKSIEELAAEGFVLDSETRAYVSEVIWDNIASMNNQYYEMQKNGLLNYYQYGSYEEGEKIVTELKQAHFAQIEYWKSLYYDKLWADELTNIATYNRRHTKYAQDANGEWYATGFYPSWFTPITLGPGETEGEYQYVMSRENDWATESVVRNDASTGERGLIPVQTFGGAVPDISSWSEDGSDTGHSATWNKNHSNEAAGYDPTGETLSPTISALGGGGYGYRRSGGGGGGGGSSAPNLYYRASAPNAPNATVSRRTNRKDADLEYLRPNFETKGSREAYKRSDI